MSSLERLSDGGYIERFPGLGIYYWKNRLHHREDGPAIEMESGDKFWIIRGQYHREDGPAIEFSNGDIRWYYNNVRYYPKNNEQWIRMCKMKVLL